MIDEPTLVFSTSPELFFIHDKLVASQASYNIAYMKESYHEVKHFYCGTCGDEWGMRIAPAFEPTAHHFYKSPCVKHGGDECMLNPLEFRRLDILGPEVLAYTIYQKTEEVYNV